MGVSRSDTPNFLGCRPPAHAGVSTESDERRERQAGVPGGSVLQAVEALRTWNPKVKGGMSAMAKKAAKGGKKKAGKKR